MASVINAPNEHDSCRPGAHAQNVMAIAARVQRPWLAVYPKGRHAAICQYLDSFLALLDNFLENA